MSKLIGSQIKKLDRHIEEYKQAWKDRKEIEAIYGAPLLKDMDIVAMTTTGRAKNAEFLSKVNFPIVIVEEAAEVFEAHVITALSDKTEHVILIGDHEQLRPSPAVHQLDV